MPVELDPDAALMLRVKQGDTAAFTTLVEKYKQPVMNLAWRTLRDETEWPETVEAGGNVVTGLDRPRAVEAVARAIAQRHEAASDSAIERWFGDGHAAERIVDAILRMLAKHRAAR